MSAGPALATLRKTVEAAVRDVRVTDIHTHLYAPCFGDLLLWGIDELLTYHYLVAEFFRASDLPYEKFWKLPRDGRADLIWKALFLDRSPLSEACRGVVTVLNRLGFDPGRRDLAEVRRWFAGQKREAYLEKVFGTSGMRDCVMTNDPFDDAERPVWFKGYAADERFKAALRIDPLLLGWGKAAPRLKEWGYEVGAKLAPGTLREIRRFLREWAERTRGLYVGVSLPPSFAFPDGSTTSGLLEKAVLPVCEELNLPLALMIGVKRRVNPELRMAGDGMGLARIEPVEALCAAHPRNKFMVTMLSRGNQHDLCVAARKFRNLHVFGCWWFVNNPSIIDEMTRERFELLGTGFTPQHSDARILDQVIYKWEHSRKIVGEILFEKYADLKASGWRVEDREIKRDVEALFGGNFRQFLALRL